MMRKAAL
jgi:hypothetical protein